MNGIRERGRKVKVGIVKIGAPTYPTDSPYHPSAEYPEYPFKDHFSSRQNLVYDGVRQLFFNLEFDREHWGTSQWNPLGHIIKPGMTVVIKPNFVLSKHAEGKDIFSIITHPSVLRAVVDYCWIVLKGEGKIIIADAPQYNCDFSELLEETKLDEVCDFYSQFSGPKVEFLDLRNYWSKTRHFPSCIRKLPGDPQGHIVVNLGSKSALCNHPHPERFYGAVYHRSELTSHHSGQIQEYELSRTALCADVIISVPKLKVHKKVGVTLNLKGLVGMCTNKNFLLHYTLGSSLEGGDQYPAGLFTAAEEALIKIERWMYDNFLARRSIILEYIHRIAYWLHGAFIRPFGWKVSEEKRLLDAGNWYGNDSAWRMVVDLFKALCFADKEGTLHPTRQRRLFSIIDGIVGGENKGPLIPEPKPAGVLIGGENFLAVDLVATRLMGFDPLKMPMYFSVLADTDFDYGVRCFDDIEILCNSDEWRQCFKNKTGKFLDFKPYPGWTGHIEVGG